MGRVHAETFSVYVPFISLLGEKGEGGVLSSPFWVLDNITVGWPTRHNHTMIHVGLKLTH